MNVFVMVDLYSPFSLCHYNVLGPLSLHVVPSYTHDLDTEVELFTEIRDVF